MNKILFIGILAIFGILMSGCVSSVNPVEPSDVFMNVTPVTMKEFQEKDISVALSNNGSAPIDSVKVISLEPFTVVSGGMVNIPARTDRGPTSAILDAKIQAPGFKTDTTASKVTISYASGMDEKGEPVIKTKTIPVQMMVFPDAKLQYVGFVKGLANLSEAEVTSWEIGKGQNATITFSVKNDGRTTIDENSLKVVVDVAEKRIGTNKTLVIGEAMARGGTSFTEGVLVPILKDAPNGETDVTVTLFMGDKIIDSKTLQLKVRL